MPLEALALVKDRIRKLPDQTRQTILIAWVLGNNIKIDHFKQVVSDSLMPLAQLESQNSYGKLPPKFEQWLDDDKKLIPNFFHFVCDKLKFEHLISNYSSHLGFFHDKIREAAYDLLPPQGRTPIHKCYGEILAIMLRNEEANGQKPSSKDIFEAAFHIMKGFAGTQSRIARDLLHLASIRAIDSFEIAKANEYPSFASTLFDRVLNAKDKELRVKIHTSWANCLAISESIEDAITLCQEILLFVTDPLQKAEAYSKLADFHMQMFRHTESLEAGIKGLDLLNEKLIYKKTKGFIYALLMVQKLL